MLIWVSVKSTEGVAATALETSQSHTLSARAASIRSCRPASLVRSWRLDRLHKHGTFWYRLLGSIFFFFFTHHRLLLLPGSRITRTASLLENKLRVALGAQSHGGWTPEKATEVLTHHRSLGRTLRARLLIRSLQIHIRSLPIYLSIYLSLSLSLSTCRSMRFFVYRTSLLSSLALSKARIGTSKQAAGTSAKKTQSCRCCCWKNERKSFELWWKSNQISTVFQSQKNWRKLLKQGLARCHLPHATSTTSEWRWSFLARKHTTLSAAASGRSFGAVPPLSSSARLLRCRLLLRTNPLASSFPFALFLFLFFHFVFFFSFSFPQL